MGYRCSFLDNTAYTAQDVNDIFARIVSGGVVFTDTGYVLSDLNEALAQTVGAGVTRDVNSCKVVKEDGVYKISKGACFMHDGSSVVFDENGVVIDIEQGVTNYVYLKRNDMDNTIDIVVSRAWGDENTVPLAYIDASGEIHDRRAYAKAKVELLTASNIRNCDGNIKCIGTTSETVSVDMGDGQFSYVIIWGGETKLGSEVQERVSNGKNLIELAEDSLVYVGTGRHLTDNQELLNITKKGQCLEFYLERATPYAEYTFNMGVI